MNDEPIQWSRALFGLVYLIHGGFGWLGGVNSRTWSQTNKLAMAIQYIYIIICIHIYIYTYRFKCFGFHLCFPRAKDSSFDLQGSSASARDSHVKFLQTARNPISQQVRPPNLRKSPKVCPLFGVMSPTEQCGGTLTPLGKVRTTPMVSWKVDGSWWQVDDSCLSFR